MAFFCRKGKCLLTTALLYINIIALKTRASNISTDRERREGWLSSDYLQARGLQTAECRSIATLITRKIEPHIEILNLNMKCFKGANKPRSCLLNLQNSTCFFLQLFRNVLILFTCKSDNVSKERSEGARVGNIL